MVLPEPVGPVMMTTPLGASSAFSWKLLQHARPHPQLRHIEEMTPLIEQTNDDCFAVDRNVRRHSKIDFGLRILKEEPAVLMPPLFGDIDFGHDLQPARQSGRKIRG